VIAKKVSLATKHNPLKVDRSYRRFGIEAWISARVACRKIGGVGFAAVSYRTYLRRSERGYFAPFVLGRVHKDAEHRGIVECR
jgi:hypothetical protein